MSWCIPVIPPMLPDGITVTPASAPTLAGFQNFIISVMGISSAALPPSSPIIQYALIVASEIVNTDLNLISGNLYTLAVYNLAASNLINYAQDQPGETVFSDLRKQYGAGAFVAGVVASSSDNGSSESLLVPEVMSKLTFANLQQLQDPYGRQYLAFAQSIGPTVWGIS